MDTNGSKHGSCSKSTQSLVEQVEKRHDSAAVRRWVDKGHGVRTLIRALLERKPTDGAQKVADCSQPFSKQSGCCLVVNVRSASPRRAGTCSKALLQC